MEDHELSLELAERFKKLPSAVQKAITSADVEAHMRELAQKHKLHMDQWEKLENEVMLTLLGFQPTQDLARNIAHEVSVHEDTAEALAADISQIVFAPIREELERALPQESATPTPAPVAPPLATPAPTPTATTTQSSVQPATPPKGAPQETVARAALPPSYAPSQASHERKEVQGDPYREQIG